MEALWEPRALAKPLCPFWLQFPFNKKVQTLSYCPRAGNPKGRVSHRVATHLVAPPGCSLNTSHSPCARVTLGKASPPNLLLLLRDSPSTPVPHSKALGHLLDVPLALRPGTMSCPFCLVNIHQICLPPLPFSWSPQTLSFPTEIPVRASQPSGSPLQSNQSSYTIPLLPESSLSSTVPRNKADALLLPESHMPYPSSHFMP